MAPTQKHVEVPQLSIDNGGESTKMGTATSRDNWLKQDTGAPFKSQDLSKTALKIALLSISSRELRITSPKAPQSLTGKTCSTNLSGKWEANVHAARHRSEHKNLRFEATTEKQYGLRKRTVTSRLLLGETPRNKVRKC
jgi:hypothetical protein